VELEIERSGSCEKPEAGCLATLAHLVTVASRVKQLPTNAELRIAAKRALLLSTRHFPNLSSHVGDPPTSPHILFFIHLSLTLNCTQHLLYISTYSFTRYCEIALVELLIPLAFDLHLPSGGPTSYENTPPLRHAGCALIVVSAYLSLPLHPILSISTL